MIAKTIVDSDAFLDMPSSAQALYFHLSVRGDDDGFVNNPKKIQKIANCSDDDLKLLIMKRFIIPFESGVICIKHWKIHNYIRSDRYKETVYKDEKEHIELKENGTYSLKNDGGLTFGIPVVDQRLTQVRLGEGRVGKGNTIEQKTLDNNFNEFWTAYPKKRAKADAVKAWKKLKVDDALLAVILKAVSEQKKSADWLKEEGKFIPHPASWLNGGRWEDEIKGVDGVKKYERLRLPED